MLADRGTYTIQNVMHKSIVTQSLESTVVADAETDSGPSHGLNLDLRMLWAISRLNNDKYTIRNVETNDIYTTFALTELFWGLTDGELLTPICLRNIPNHPSNQWVVTKIASRKELEDETLQLRAKLTELQEENTQLHYGIDLLNAAAVNASADAQRERERYEQADRQLREKLAELQEENTKLRDSIDLVNATEDIQCLALEPTTTTLSIDSTWSVVDD
ncbi:hypothetical protein BD410DRAFT_840775 [Rickenella mellea]|uniref:Uncharacterized protein n=1 Tax=Rickenella mellea TaxID=50990 RepID=A0A4Y7Q087_9AGAM|nr:hypothetical protein BD410DRAFT_840775 [Rickenella mellea]